MSEKDPFYNLKYIAYCRVNLPPKSSEIEYQDYVVHAKTSLCLATKTLMKDPVWETYSDEDILVEYYTVLLSKNPEFREKLEAQLNGSYLSEDDWVKWAHDKEDENALKDTEDDLSFSPEDILNG